MKRLMPAAVAAAAAATLAACSDAAVNYVCPDVPSPAVIVRVTDGPSQQRAELLATGTWSTGVLSDSLRHVAAGADRYLAAFGPAGTYTVRVQRPGFASWERSGVVVLNGSCGPATQELSATLAPG